MSLTANERAISPRQIAQTLDVSKRTVCHIIQTGKLRAHRVGRQWRVFEGDLEDYLAKRVNCEPADSNRAEAAR